ncbi:DNA polymerase III subunit beta [Candidatus Parcubacteria bacterium]|nr:DNA polymerase III subunit beta [Candidatus Parcubacteria bacterium]
MKIECTTDILVEAVGKSEKITGKNLTLPVLSCILLEAKGKILTLRATNLDLGIEITIPAKITKEGTIAVPGTILNNFLGTLRNKTVTLEGSEGNLKVTTETNTTVIKSLNHEDFPTIPQLKGDKTLTLSARDVIKGIKSVWYSSATSSMKPELSSIYIYADEDTAIFVATDSFRLAEKKVKMKNARDIGSLLIPVKNVPDILRILESCPGEVEVSFTKNQISFTYSGVYLTSRVVDGVFPDYRQIIPKSYTTHVTTLKQDLISAFRVATIFSDKFNKLSVKINPKEKKFELSTRNADVGENSTSLEAVIEGDPIEINFNYKYITDCFQSVDADSVTLEFNGVTKPLIARGVNDKSFMYLVMPINK